MIWLLALLGGCESFHLAPGDDHIDVDGDGFDGWTDCDDFDATIYPGAVELCDGVDNDCDGTEDDALDALTAYPDADGDGYGEPDGAARTCALPAGDVLVPGDCDDDDPAVYPYASEFDCADPIDYNCDGWTYWDDFDHDGTPLCEDCDDRDGTVFPSAEELCDGRDNDCDGQVDEAGGGFVWYRDADGDGWGDGAVVLEACQRPAGHVADATDCDDGRVDVHPSAIERCDGADNDCDGDADEPDDAGSDAWHLDLDGDGYGDPADPVASCTAVDGRVPDGTDCDDGDVAIHPDADERCDGVDRDCDGVVDEDDAIDASVWFVDVDLDGFGDARGVVTACSLRAGLAATGDDCDDADPAASPALPERCGGADEDCDGTIDEDDAIDASSWHLDGDADGFGDPASGAPACVGPADRLLDGTDCDDLRADVHPGAPEADCADPVDYNCDGSVGAVDADGDAWTACLECDDGDAAVNPDAVETCATVVDDDCDGDDNDVGADGCIDYYGDLDGDGVAGTAACQCEADATYAFTTSEDCDDADATVSPDLPEACDDGLDNDCDGTSNGCGGVGEIALGDTTRFTGGTAGDLAGVQVSFSGDTDGDGYDDLLVGAKGADGFAGAVYLLRGPTSGSAALADADTILLGLYATDRAGWATSAAGDTNGDGFGDILVGAPFSDTGGVDAGTVYLLEGPVTSDLASADATFEGSAAGDFAGGAVDPAGDVDGDGYADVLVGAPYNDDAGTEAGAAYLLSGPLAGSRSLPAADAVLLGRSINGEAGWAVAGAGDVDGDGFDDVLVGAYADDGAAANAGAAFVFLGPIAGTLSLSTADGSLNGGTAGEGMGFDVAGAEDVDGDGLADMVIGVPYVDSTARDAGGAYLFLGRDAGALLATAEARVYGETLTDYAGGSVAGGDVDGDGRGDLLVSANGSDRGGSGAGAVYLLLGPISGTLGLGAADGILSGEGDGHYAGDSVAIGGDVDADGYADMLVGASRYDAVAVQAGAAYLIFGGTGL